MSTFTDDDLRQLKGLIDMMVSGAVDIESNKLPALLARLEAAEALICRLTPGSCDCRWDRENGQPRDWVECPAHEAWRKVAGK